MTTIQERLQKFFRRRHPEYEDKKGHWAFLEATYKGGRDWFKSNIFRYLKEGDTEFGDRLERAYRFNHTREVVDLVQKYLFKSKIARNVEDAPEVVRNFWDSATLSNLDIDQFMKTASSLSSIFGRVWIFVDNNIPENALTVQELKNSGSRTYAYIIKPLDMLDMGFNDDGSLRWVKVREYTRDDADPIDSSGDMIERIRLWTETSWQLFEEVDAGRRGKVVRLIDSGTHNLGRVPCFPHDHMMGEHRYSSPALINDIAYLDRAIANYLSNLDAIIQDQTYSQLAMPAQNALPGEETYDQLKEMGTKRIFLYDGEGGAAPMYLSPDPKQAQLIIEVINKIISEIYHTIGMAGERTKQDNAVGIDNSSGVAKAYDFERVNSLLASKAQCLENAENELVKLVCLWYGEPVPAEELVSYPDNFDVRSLSDEFAIAEQLGLIEAPDIVRREQMRQVIEKLFPRLSKDLRKEMEEELKEWPPEMPEGLGLGMAAPANDGAPAATLDNRQGEVTAATD